MEQEKSSSKHSENLIYKIPRQLPSLNEYIHKLNHNRFSGAKFKKDIEEEIMWHFRKMPEFKNPIRVHFIWVETSHRRDFDNIASARKYIFDSMVKLGKIPDDSQKWVKGFSDTFVYDTEACVILEIKEEKER